MGDNDCYKYYREYGVVILGMQRWTFSAMLDDLQVAELLSFFWCCALWLNEGEETNILQNSH